VALTPKASSGETTAASGFWGITLSLSLSLSHDALR
jgi:hypothetical protein